MKLNIGDYVNILGLDGMFEVLKIEGSKIYYSPSNCGHADDGFYALDCYVTKVELDAEV